MRSRLAHAAVFICVFALFLGYCEWWKARPEVAARLNTQPPPDRGAWFVEGAADETFNGAYIPMQTADGEQYFVKQGPLRFLWQSDERWHLSTQRGMMADGYMTETGGSPSSAWQVDGSLDPAPTVSRIPEFTEPPLPEQPVVTAAQSPGGPHESCPASPDDIPATSPG